MVGLPSGPGSKQQPSWHGEAWQGKPPFGAVSFQAPCGAPDVADQAQPGRQVPALCFARHSLHSSRPAGLAERLTTLPRMLRRFVQFVHQCHVSPLDFLIHSAMSILPLASV